MMFRLSIRSHTGTGNSLVRIEWVEWIGVLGSTLPQHLRKRVDTICKWWFRWPHETSLLPKLFCCGTSFHLSGRKVEVKYATIRDSWLPLKFRVNRTSARGGHFYFPSLQKGSMNPGDSDRPPLAEHWFCSLLMFSSHGKALGFITITLTLCWIQLLFSMPGWPWTRMMEKTTDSLIVGNTSVKITLVMHNREKL
jgi:hypothetical protein